MTKEYIGDSVYIEYDDLGNIVITTENGGTYPSNRIFMDEEVVMNFLEFLNHVAMKNGAKPWVIRAPNKPS